MATETHIAGLQMDVQGRYLLQRCGWCGTVMLAYDRTRVSVAGDEYHDPALFAVGRLIRFSYDGTVARWGEVALSRTSMVMLDETDELPDDACALNIPFEGGATHTPEEIPDDAEWCVLHKSGARIMRYSRRSAEATAAGYGGNATLMWRTKWRVAPAVQIQEEQ